jgi:hypothetical protein
VRGKFSHFADDIFGDSDKHKWPNTNF